MKRILQWSGWILVVALFSYNVGAMDTVATWRRSDALGDTGGTKISTLSLSSDRWTGWMNTSRVGLLELDNTLTDANGSVTTVTVRCEGSEDNTISNDAGFDIPVTPSTTTAGVTSIVPGTLTWTSDGTNPPTGAAGASSPAKITFQVGVRNSFTNCLYHATGAAAAGDTILVVARGVSP